MEINWTVMVGAVTAICVFLATGVPFFKWVADSLSEWSKSRRERKKINDSTSIEFRKLESDDRDKSFEELQIILSEKKEEVNALKFEIIELKKGNSLSQSTVSKIYSAVGKLEPIINHLEWLITRDEKFKELNAPIAILKELFQELLQELLDRLP